MRRAYLYDQAATDADHMDAGDPFIDTPSTERIALGDLVDRGGLVDGDTLVVTAKSKLGHGQGFARIERQLATMGVAVEVNPAPARPKTMRGKKRPPSADDLTYLRGVWTSAMLDPANALAQASRHMGFEVDRNWMNYHVCKRDGGPSTKEQKEPET